MQRLCGRPGCSDVASVAYGMRAEDLVFWLDRLPEQPEDNAAVLCRRHADTMVVPRGWTLDDLRDPDLHLFRPPLPAPLPAPTRRTRTPRRDPDHTAEQLQLSTVPEPPAITTPSDEPHVGGVDDDGDVAAAGSGPWSPSFDEADDLDGLLSARGPLLSRAFRTADRPGD